MASSGRVVHWRTEKGYGFIEPDDGGANVFCHVSALPVDRQQLVAGERVRYDVGCGPDGRLRAENVVPRALGGADTLLAHLADERSANLHALFANLGLGPGASPAAVRPAASLGAPRPGRRGRSFVATEKAGSEPICMRFAARGSCGGDLGGRCAGGCHLLPEEDSPPAVLQVSKAKLRLLQQKWKDAEGPGSLERAWQLRNPRLEYLFGATKHNFGMAGRSLDMIDGWHGTPDANVLSIVEHGFDKSRRSGQVYGSGEYFAKDPRVSINYARGGSFLILCKLLLGEQDEDHTWVPDKKYYVLKQESENVQVLPIFVLQFREGASELSRSLERRASSAEEDAAMPELSRCMRGGTRPEEGRPTASMSAASTRYLWLGWLDPKLLRAADAAIVSDVKSFLQDLRVREVIPERNGARVGAYVLLHEPISRSTFLELQQRMYRGQYRISVDDQQPDDPHKALQPCPRLTGPAKACRGWNILGHAKWHMACPFSHAEHLRPTFRATFSYEDLPAGTAKHDELETELMRSAPFPNSHGVSATPRIVRIRRIHNETLRKLYEERRAYTQKKQGAAEERELWHGTSPAALRDLLTHGFQPPADRKASRTCPRSGCGKGLCTTLCDRSCRHCVEPHVWDRCHMFGLGVYFADLSKKSHRYVRGEMGSDVGKEVYSLLRCRVMLGRPYLIEGNLLAPDALHDFLLCDDPSDALETAAEDWATTGHDAFYVRGLQRSMKSERGVYNSEYIVFHAWQALPLYRVDYTLQ